MAEQRLACCGERRNEKKDGECVGQAWGGFKARLRRQEAHGAWPARSAGRRRAAHTRPVLSEPGRPCSLNRSSENAIQSSSKVTDRACLTIINSKSVAIQIKA